MRREAVCQKLMAFCTGIGVKLKPFAQTGIPFMNFQCEWASKCVPGSGLTEACPPSWAQYAWGSGTWPHPSICLSSFAKLQGTTYYGVILLIGPFSSPPHSCRVPPHSVRMEYACKPPPWNCSTRAPPALFHVKALAGKYCAFKLK